MNTTMASLLTCLALLGLPVGGLAVAADLDPMAERPYRVLVVIGDQWDDPDSYCIGGPCVPGKDFRDVATMLKIWGVPFDILRLDQQRLQINRFLNGIAEPNYGCVIWMADPDKLDGASANFGTMRSAVEDYGMSLIALFDYIKTPEIADLVGVEYQDTARMEVKDEKGRFVVTEEHFITADAEATVLPPADESTQVTVVRCKAKPAAKVIGRLGEYPQLVVRDVNQQTKTVWIGGGRDWLNKYAVMRSVFRRSLVHCMGYGVFNDNFENTLVFVMDDMGASDHAYGLPEWHYPTPSKEAIIKYLVEPLEEYGFVMVQNVTPGFVNPVTRRVENPWTIEKFVDPYGNVQDYGSTKVGLDEGVRRGVFEIHTHRVWTHMNWDLDSLPGPWWDAPLDGERARGAWYSEAYDFVRDVPVPSNDALFLYKTGYDAIRRQFGVAPLAVSLQPIGTDERLRHGNGRLAAVAGYGISWTTKYIGYDRLVHFSIPGMIPERLHCHDLDLIEKSDSEITGRLSELRKMPASTLIAAKVTGSRAVDLTGSRDWIESRKDKRWIGFDEICAHLHSDIDISVNDGLTIQFRYDDHYCRHFAKHASRWTLELADYYREQLGRQIDIETDGNIAQRAPAPRQTVTLPAGIGVHTVQISPGYPEILPGGPPEPTLTPLVRVVDMNVGESQAVELCNGNTAMVKLLDLEETRDSVRSAVRVARLKVQVNDRPLTLSAGVYNLPVTIAGVQIDCSVTKGYTTRSTADRWGLEKDARFRLWPAGSPLTRPGTLGYPLNQRWLASRTWMSNEPIDRGKEIRDGIYYHSGLDFGGAEGLDIVLAATDGLVVARGTDVLPGYEDTPVYRLKPRPDVVYVVDARGWFYRYSHLRSVDPSIRLGQTVKMGQKIGLLGKEGASGGWSHLHFEIKCRQPSGKWGTQDSYALAFEAYRRQYSPKLVAVARPSHLVWVGEKVVLDGTRSWSAGDKLDRYDWVFDDGSTASGPTVDRTYDRPGTYSEILKVTDAEGNVDYDFSDTLVMDKTRPKRFPPYIHAAFWPTVGITPHDPVTFKVRSFYAEGGREVWHFGDGSPPVEVQSDSNADPHAEDGYSVTVHRYEKPGDYLVRVARTDEHGQTARTRLHVRVVENR